MKKFNHEKFKRICLKNKLKLCYLFGSQANSGLKILRGKKVKVMDAESDLDIGIVFKHGLPSNKRVIYGEIYNEFSEIFTPLKVDLIFLEEVDYLLQYEAINGILIFKESIKTKGEYEERVLKFAADFKFEYELYQQEVMKAIEDGYFEFEY